MTSLPRYFLQDFELVKHPETGEPWWAPGTLSLERVLKEETPAGENKTYRRGPIVGYVLCRKTVVDMLGSGGNRKRAARLISLRSGMALTPDTRGSVWRPDMGDILLAMLRRHAVDALVARSCRTQEPRDKFVHPCASWDEVEGVMGRGCVLWLPDQNKKGAAGQYATLDVEGTQYGRKMAVHNLFWLLGDEEAQRLRRESPMFGENEVLVLKQWNSVYMMNLHLLLWRLQGYLAPAEGKESLDCTTLAPSR